MCLKISQNIKFVPVRCVFSFKLQMHQNRFSRPDSVGELTTLPNRVRTLPRPLVGWEGWGHPLPILFPLNASISAPASVLRPFQQKFLATPMMNKKPCGVTHRYKRENKDLQPTNK